MTNFCWEQRCNLAMCFAPHLVLFPEQQSLLRPGKIQQSIGDYHPRGVGPLIERAKISFGLFRPRRHATVEALAQSQNANDQLLLLGRWIPDPERAWISYFHILNDDGASGQTGRDRFPLTVYARVLTRAEANAASMSQVNLGRDYPLSEDEVGRPLFDRRSSSESDVAIQYWFCYYYDDWANQHEGDWEGISIFLRPSAAGYEPVGAGYYAHETGKRRRWTDIERSNLGSTHSLVFVAAGSHASYFEYTAGGYLVTVPGLILPLLDLRLRVSVSTTRVDRVPDRDHYLPVQPRVELLPDPIGPANHDDPVWENQKWLSFPGAWGARILGGLAYGGPTGPSHKGLKWHNPFAWMERYCTPDFLVY